MAQRSLLLSESIVVRGRTYLLRRTTRVAGCSLRYGAYRYVWLVVLVSRRCVSYCNVRPFWLVGGRWSPPLRIPLRVPFASSSNEDTLHTVKVRRTSFTSDTTSSHRIGYTSTHTALSPSPPASLAEHEPLYFHIRPTLYSILRRSSSDKQPP